MSPAAPHPPGLSEEVGDSMLNSRGLVNGGKCGAEPPAATRPDVGLVCPVPLAGAMIHASGSRV